jgi:imidazolonepropionase-like amidohydrolase
MEPKMIALTNARINTITKGIINKGTLIFDKGLITAIGAKVKIPKLAEIIDVKGKNVTPGLIDAHSHAGLTEEGFFHDGDYNEISDPVTPQMMAIDAFKPSDLALWEAAEGGITTIFVTPGSANVFCGMGAIAKTWGQTLEDYTVNPAAGLKMAMGENPKRVYGSKGKAPTTRMGIGSIMRETLTSANNYLARKEANKNKKGKKSEPFDIDLKMEAVAKLLRKEVPARCHAHRSIDMLTFLRVAKEFKIDVVFEHATEAIDILDELKKRNIPVIIGPTMGSRGKKELVRKSFETAVHAFKKGLLVAITADHSVLPLCYLPVYAALTVRAGLSEEDAMKAITINPAKILGIDKKLGSLEVKKQADIVIWTGDPLDARSKPEMVFIGGEKISQPNHVQCL